MQPRAPRTVWACPWWRVEEQPFCGPDGVERVWYTARRPNPETVHLLGLTPDGLTPVLRQYRVPFDAWVWELPAGLCDQPGEAMEATALRELEEETGYRAARAVPLFRGTVSPGLTDEMYNAYLCLDLQQVGPGGGVRGERIEVHRIPFAELLDWALDKAARGELIDSKVATHAVLAQRWLARNCNAAG